jgi:hypothetical protein
MYAKQYDLKLVKAPFDIPPIELQMQWHKYRDQNPALVWFRELLQSVTREIWRAVRRRRPAPYTQRAIRQTLSLISCCASSNLPSCSMTFFASCIRRSSFE